MNIKSANYGRSLTTNEMNQLKGAFPQIDFNGINYLGDIDKDYNCIGWALGIKELISPPVLGNYFMHKIKVHILSFFERKYSKDSIYKEAISQLLIDQKKLHLQNDTNNFDHILDNKFVLLDKCPVTPKNNTLAFYFSDNLCHHASRYITTFFNVVTDSWTSKLGQDMLISHKKLNDLYGYYGNEVKCAEISTGSYPGDYKIIGQGYKCIGTSVNEFL